MTSPAQIAAARRELRSGLFPEGVPSVWCPSITHYRSDGGIDTSRMAAHLRHLAPHVKGFLIPGSTGDGWEMDADETRRLLELALEQCAALRLHLLIGVLKADAEAARQTMLEITKWLRSRAGAPDDATALREARVSGFTVCSPHGANLAQEEIAGGLSAILATGLPVALYQLPQVTRNEISPALVARLAAEHANFILFKDTSGADRVALSDLTLDGVFLVRGAEGDYARWLKQAGGRYDGFLLSTANCFGRELDQLIRDLAVGRIEKAQDLSNRLGAVVKEVFAVVSGLPHGNAFANANKAMDHFFAHGPKAAAVPAPRLHAGTTLPAEVIRAAGEALSRHGFMPVRGYLE